MADQSPAVDPLVGTDQKPPGDPNAKLGGADLAKVAAGLVVCLASIGFFIHRIPHHEYVQVHADKPRPPRPKADSDDASVAVTPAPKPAAKAGSPAPASKPPSAASAAKGVSSAQTAASDKPVVELEDACAAEAPLLCYHVSPARLPRCLSQYDDALRKTCRDAVEEKLAELDKKH